ncbi:MAG TPA: phosphodiester glycosidase family protein [Polyangiaceae bacterium]
MKPSADGPKAPSSASSEPPRRPDSSGSGAATPPADSASSSGNAAPASKPSPPAVAFPPADFSPPFERSAKPGDGKWVALGDGARGDFAAAAPHVLFRTVVHPHPVSRFVSVTVVAVDLSRAAVHLVAGTEDPVALHVPESERTGLVPSDHQTSLLALFNGGYQTPHGRWGVMIGDQVLVPPRDVGCTIALYRDGSARIASWPALAKTQGTMAAFRQTPPCLVEGGALHADLAAFREGAWGGRVPNVKTRNRSAVGVDASGRVLFYGFGDEAGARLLADGMRFAGAVAAAQLDINYYWTRFLLVGKKKPEAPLSITSPLAPKMQYEPRGYVSRPAARDFFYVKRR